MIKVDDDELKVVGDIGTILAEITYLILRLLQLGIKYDLIEMAVKNGFKYYLKEKK